MEIREVEVSSSLKHKEKTLGSLTVALCVASTPRCERGVCFYIGIG